jgi:hypothetical protein
MRTSRRVRLILAVLVIGGAVSSCSSGVDVSADELSDVVQRDAVVFGVSSIPDAVLDLFDDYQVVLLGETHHLREHWAFVAELLGDLHEDGFRQVLIEAPHMAGWQFDDYVQGGLIAPEWEPPAFWGRRLLPFRALNENLAPEERIHVRGIDANESWYGGAQAFEDLLGWLADHLPTRGPIDGFAGRGYSLAGEDEQAAMIETLMSEVAADQTSLVSAWGADWYEEVGEMLEVELASIAIRSERERDDNAGARAREAVIKQLSDEIIAECACGTVINIGAHHAQKSHLMGTEQEWMGDYLAHTSTVVGGSLIVVGFASALTQLEPGAGGTPWDILESNSPDNEVLRILAETWPAETVFLPLDDPLFVDRKVAFNSEDVIYATSLGEQYDALIQYGIAHRMPQD